MKAIPWEDKTLTSRQEEILIGSLLGDARLECRSKQGTARLRFHHADSQRSLLFWKYKEFQWFVDREPWQTDWYDRRYRRWYRSWFCHTRTSRSFSSIYARFYANGRKRVPDDIAVDLTPLSIAVWMVDDGCAADDSFILNTQSFAFDEQKNLLECLARRYNVHGTINRDRRNYRLRFNRSNTNRLRSLVRPFAIPTLNTKLVPVTTASVEKR